MSHHLNQSYPRNVRLINPHHSEPSSSLTSITTGFYGTSFHDITFRNTAFHYAFIRLSLPVLALTSNYLYLDKFYINIIKATATLSIELTAAFGLWLMRQDTKSELKLSIN